MPHLAPLIALALLGQTVQPPPAACANMSFPIYFAHGGVSVSALARAVVAEAASQIAACSVRQVRLTAEDGAAEQNADARDLPRARAEAVAGALAAAGVDRRLILVSGASAADGPTPRPARVIVQIVLEPAAAPAPVPGRYMAAAGRQA
jgi:hypothetical protein